MGGGLRPAASFRQVCEPAPPHPPLHGELAGRTHRPQRGTALRPRRRVLGRRVHGQLLRDEEVTC